MSACILPMNDVGAPQLFRILCGHAFYATGGNSIIFFYYWQQNGKNKGSGNKIFFYFLFENRMKCGTMKRKMWTLLLECFREKEEEEKNQQARGEKKMLNRSQKSVNILWIFCPERFLFLVSMLLGPLFMFIGKTFCKFNHFGCMTRWFCNGGHGTDFGWMQMFN